MGEFHESVSTLLGFFAEGLSNIRAQKEKQSRRRLASEARLSESLKKSRNEVKSAYDRDLEKFGDSFAKGDGIPPILPEPSHLLKDSSRSEVFDSYYSFTFSCWDIVYCYQTLQGEGHSFRLSDSSEPLGCHEAGNHSDI
jgi:hypothetical protein